jgi:hypothetical protein
MSPIPLGFWATAGAGGAGGGPAFELIETASVSGSSTAISFGSIPQTYKHLQIRVVSKSSSAGPEYYVTFNGVGGTSYSSHAIYADNSGPYGRNNINGGWGYIRGAAAVSSTANAHGAGIIDILNYSDTSVNTTVRSIAGTPYPNSTGRNYVQSILFNNTAAITQIQMQMDTGNITSQSRFSLYGIKG